MKDFLIELSIGVVGVALLALLFIHGCNPDLPPKNYQNRCFKYPDGSEFRVSKQLVKGYNIEFYRTGSKSYITKFELDQIINSEIDCPENR